MKEQVLHIRHTLQRIQNKEQYFGEPKTVLYLGSPKNKRERTIPLHPQIIPILEKLEKSCYPSFIRKFVSHRASDDDQPF